MPLEDIVPPLELCRMILSERAFVHTALAWVCIGEIKKEEEWIVVENNCALIYALGGHYTTPAPTLAEILEADHRMTITWSHTGITWAAEVWDGSRWYARNDINSATAAMKLWLEVNGVEVEK